jgi:hypothetical protein
MAFRPRGGNVRRKQRSTVESDDDDVDEIAKKLTKAKSAPRPASVAAKPAVAKKLSLDDEDGEEIFKKKKKKPKSRGVSTAALNETAEQTGTEGGASYSDAALSELKSQTPKMPSGMKATKVSEGLLPIGQNSLTLIVLGAVVAPAEVSTPLTHTNTRAAPAVIRISGSFRSNISAMSHESAMPETFKQPAKPVPDSFSIKAPSAPPIPPPATGKASKQQAKGAGLQDDDGNDEDDDGDFTIPTAELIQKAKEKRLRLRGAKMAPGYVPSDHPDFKTLKEFKRSEDAIKKGSDDDGSDDEPEDDMRLKFSGGVPSLFS